MNNPIMDAFEKMDSRHEQAEQLYTALRANEKIRKKTLALVYRCHNRERCTLAEIYPSPQGVLVHLPPYKRSPERNAETSNAEGREVNTLDGDRRWKGNSFFIEYALNLTLNCDHVDSRIIDREQVLSDLKSDQKSIVLDAPD